MYEHPTITPVGEVNDVVLGIASIGTDIDMTMVFGEFEFQQDVEGEEDR